MNITREVMNIGDKRAFIGAMSMNIGYFCILNVKKYTDSLWNYQESMQWYVEVHKELVLRQQS